MSDRFSNRSILLIAAAALVIGLGSWLSSRYIPADIDPETGKSSNETPQGAVPAAPTESFRANETAPPPRASAARIIERHDPGRSPLADRLNDPAGGIRDDLAILQKVLANYSLALGSNPVGNNAEITAQLTGRNPRHHAPIPADHPAIDAQGELVDRWGTPFHFHALGARQMEIVSAGPDRERYTSDDIEWSPLPDDSRTQLTAHAR